jgi:hypothetical protein
MGIFALDLTKPLDLEILGDNPDEAIKALKPFII